MRDAVLSGRSARAFGVHALGPIKWVGAKTVPLASKRGALCLGKIRLARRSAAHGRAPITPQTASAVWDPSPVKDIDAWWCSGLVLAAERYGAPDTFPGRRYYRRRRRCVVQ